MKIWKEKLDPKRHSDFMSTTWIGGVAVENRTNSLIERWVYFVKVEGFTFQFISIEQIEEARIYFEKRIHPPRRRPRISLEHYWQEWYERLPKGLTKESKRINILKALSSAIQQFATPTK